jgi:alpha-beta hydrolase superfamily lysophospholipase
MQTSTFRLAVDDGAELFVYRWEPEAAPPKAVVQIVHGMVEHAGRYVRLAELLTAAGYAVYAADQRGHGQTALTLGDLGYFADRDGWRRILDDQHGVNRRIAADHPGLPIFLFGHSMGSFLAQHYLFTYGDSIAGAVLSSTNAGAAVKARVGQAIAKLERLRLGPRGKSPLLQRAFSGFNRGFAPTRTEFDWLSRDASEVDKYVADPLCGFDFSVQGWIDLLDGLVEISRHENIGRVPRSLPLYLFSGERDPVGEETRGVLRLIDTYRRTGLTDLTQRFYPGGRHEMLNEENRAEVQRDLVAWLDAALARRARPHA